jgi:multimeric flavodoxin WrbA
MPKWKCGVCGYETEADVPPEDCPSCGSTREEFYVKGSRPKDDLEGKPELLIINGSKHRAHNTAYFASIVEQAAKEYGVSYKLLNLGDYNIENCWCCYSMNEEKCGLPCKNEYDDMHKFHRLILNARAIIVVSPINWNGMPAMLKTFLDRMTCIENMYVVDRSTPCAGKTVGIIVNGHEDGAYKTCFDIFMVFQNLGFIMAPYGIAYSTHNRAFKTEFDNEYFKDDRQMEVFVRNVAHNVIEFSRIGVDNKMDIRPSCE